MPEIDFTKAFSKQAFQGLKSLIEQFLEMQSAQNATLDFDEMKVAFHKHQGEVELHILTGPEPVQLNQFPEESEFEQEDED